MPSYACFLYISLLSFRLPVCLLICLPFVGPFVALLACLSLPAELSLFLSVCPPGCLPVCLSVCLYVCMSICFSVCLSVCASRGSSGTNNYRQTSVCVPQSAIGSRATWQSEFKNRKFFFTQSVIGNCYSSIAGSTNVTVYAT
jgi:hypothetical protein